MQAVKAHEARIIDALQRNCVKAFIVIMDGQTPEKKKRNLLMFSHPSFISPPTKNSCVGPHPGRKSTNQRPGWLKLPTSSLFYATANNVVFVGELQLTLKTWTFSDTMRVRALCLPGCFFPPLTCVNDSEYLMAATTHVI